VHVMLTVCMCLFHSPLLLVFASPLLSYSVLPSIEAIYFGRKGLGNDENIEVRNAVFKAEAPALSLDSARAAIADWGGDKMDITHVVAVTCTGVIVPGQSRDQRGRPLCLRRRY
jgi:hypothetical protein